MVVKNNPTLAVTRIQEIPFIDRITMREQVLAWISSDIGLADFLVPANLAESWSAEQKQTWTDAIVDNFLNATNTDVGKLARSRVIVKEQAGILRRACDKLTLASATHRDLVKMAVTMEDLWNDVSPDLDDDTWAKCTMLHDTALVALRVAYVWLYMQAECAEASVETKKKIYETLLESHFKFSSPADNPEEKQSENFRNLLKAWRSELVLYPNDDKFDDKLKRLEETNSLPQVAMRIDRFLNRLSVDESWLWKMKQLDDKLKSGHIVRKSSTKKPRNAAPSPAVARQTYRSEEPEPESSSNEGGASDSDFDFEHAERVTNRNDDDDNDYENSSSELTDDLARGTTMAKRNNGHLVRRSIRVAKLGSVRRKRRNRAPPSRYGDSPVRKRARRKPRRKVVRIEDVQEDYDEEMPTAAEKARGRRGRPTEEYDELEQGEPTGKNSGARVELDLEAELPPASSFGEDEAYKEPGAAGLDPAAQREARKKRLMAALNSTNE